VADLNVIINKAVGDADLYGEVLAQLGRSASQAVLTLSTYDLSGPRSTLEVRAAMPGRDFLTVPAARLWEAGYEVWPTWTYIDDTPDPLGDVHFDVVVAVGDRVIPEGMVGSKAERRRARQQLQPRFVAVLELFDGPFDDSAPLAEP
jgi:hypothetical protein